MPPPERRLPPYRDSIAGTLLAARETVMAPIRPILREADVTEQQWRVLRVLKDNGAADASALARQALLFPPSVTRILKELMERGLIVRDHDVADRRRSIVSLSPAGKALIERTARQTLVELDRYAAAFGRPRLEALLGELRAFADAIAPSDESPS